VDAGGWGSILKKTRWAWKNRIFEVKMRFFCILGVKKCAKVRESARKMRLEHFQI